MEDEMGEGRARKNQLEKSVRPTDQRKNSNGNKNSPRSGGVAQLPPADGNQTAQREHQY